MHQEGESKQEQMIFQLCVKPILLDCDIFGFSVRTQASCSFKAVATREWFPVTYLLERIALPEESLHCQRCSIFALMTAIGATLSCIGIYCVVFLVPFEMQSSVPFKSLMEAPTAIIATSLARVLMVL